MFLLVSMMLISMAVAEVMLASPSLPESEPRLAELPLGTLKPSGGRWYGGWALRSTVCTGRLRGEYLALTLKYLQNMSITCET